VFLFGSRADGQGRERSDFDIGLLSSEPFDEALLRKIREAIEESTVPHKVDIVDFTRVEPEFKKQVLEGKIKIWNEAKDCPLN
jgi:predicted nucleotidyltransferase